MKWSACILDKLLALPIGRCPLCQQSARPGRFCDDCAQDIGSSRQHCGNRCRQCLLPLGSELSCPLCSVRPLGIRRLECAFDYTAPLDQLILQFKEGSRYQLASAFADLLVQRQEQVISSTTRQTVMVAVPSDPKSLRWRGYNPAWQFARQLSRQLHVPLLNGALLKHHTGQQQKNLSAQARQRHMLDRFYCPQPLPQPHVILVDDVLTTGATLRACAQALRAAGAGDVDALVIARALLPH